MRPLLQHASRSLTAHAASVASPLARSSARFVRPTPSICLRCECRASISVRSSNARQSEYLRTWSQRTFSSSTRRLEEQPKDKKAAADVADNIPRATAEPVEKMRAAADVPDNIARVPDEHLPSHRERQRWGLSKRLSGLMDEMLPKLAVVTQKVNSYTGTDYSGVEALREEIKEQENLVKARRAAIDTAKQALDIAHNGQASSQKEVVALLERKHSWSATDLERYMSLIRSEHINDQAIRQAKERVISAEAALEEARTQLEKRERAQYHEEQIWSDTIRRNSTWVTFGLMGVNIFLLLLSLAILEPWRRRRLVREIKNTLEAQRASVEAAPAAATHIAPATPPKELAAVEEAIDDASETILIAEPTPPTVAAPALEAPSVESTEQSPGIDLSTASPELPSDVTDPAPDAAVPGAAPLTPIDAGVSPQASIDIAEEVASPEAPPSKLDSWSSKVTSIAQDIVSERVISIRRIDYTTAILQSAAAGAVITGVIVAMLRPR